MVNFMLAGHRLLRLPGLVGGMVRKISWGDTALVHSVTLGQQLGNWLLWVNTNSPAITSQTCLCLTAAHLSRLVSGLKPFPNAR